MFIKRAAFWDEIDTQFSNSKISEMLSNESTNLEDVLDQDSFIMELMNDNKKLHEL